MHPNNLASCLKRGSILISLALLFILGGNTDTFSQPQPVQLLLENHPTASSNPRDMVEVNGVYYFVANDNEIWQTDGTPEGTSKLEFTLPSGGWQQVGGGNRRIRAMSVVADKLLLFGFDFIIFESDIILGEEPAIFDLISMTMSPLANINQGQWASSQAMEPHSVGSKAFFLANDGVHGTEVWVTDGTEEGTTQLVDTNDDTNTISNVNFFDIGNETYFSVGYKKLYKTDGTPDGTVLVKDFTPSNANVGYSSQEIHKIGDEVFFIVASNVRSIWKTDGTEEGTALLIDNLPSSNLRAINNELFFLQSCNSTQSCLYKVNSSVPQLELIATIPIQYLHNISTENDGIIFFEGANELWKTNGTEIGTVKVSDLESSEVTSANWTYRFVNNKILFTYYGGESGQEIWVSDGTSEGTFILKDFNPGFRSSYPELIHANDNLLFAALNSGDTGKEVWASNGNMGNALFLGDLNSSGESISIKDYKVAESDIVLRINRDFTQSQVPNLVTISEDNILTPIKSIGSYTYQNYYNSNFEILNESIFFTAKEVIGNSFSNHLFKYKDKQLEKVVDLHFSDFISETNESLFFANSDETHGQEIWSSKGTTETTSIFVDAVEGATGGAFTSELQEIEYIHGLGYFFVAIDAAHGPELWKTDLTDGGTAMVKDINEGFFGSFPTKFFAFENKLIFLTRKQNSVYELWVSDGTESGTNKLFDHSLNIGAIRYHKIGNSLYYVIRNNSFFYELWKTDGTTDGTEMVESLGQFYTSFEDPFIPFNDALIYLKKSTESGYDFFRLSGGEPENIHHSETGYLGGYNQFEDYLLFWEGDNFLNSSMWGTDGSAEGTTLLYNLTEISGVKRIDNPFQYKSDLIFQGEEEGKTFIYKLPILYPIVEIEYNGEVRDPGFEINFSEVLYNQSSEKQVITITNKGYIPLKFTGAFKFDLAGANPEDFMLDLSSISGRIIPGEQSEIGITFMPKAVGPRSATLLVLTNDENNSLLEFQLTGTGMKVKPTLSFSELPIKSVIDEPFTLETSVDTDQDISFSSSNPGIASIDGATVSIHKVGQVIITASVEATELYYDTSTEQTLRIEGVEQIVTFESLPKKTVGDEPFDLVASVDSGQEISFTSSDAEVASIEGKTVTIHKAGTTNITASVVATEVYNAASTQQSLTINGVEQTITFGELPTKTFGDTPFELSASANSDLAITFSSSDPTVASIEVNMATILKAGSVTITANQTGNDNYSSATATQTLTINKAAQNITFGALPEKTFGEASFAFSATASSSLGVTFASSDAAVASIEGATVSLLKAGTVTITASQAGNDNYLAADPVTQQLVINKAAQSITFEALPSKTFGDAPFELSATSSTGLPITFSSSNTSIINVEGNLATVAGAGSATITALQAGNDNYQPATAEQSITINKAAQSIAFEELPAIKADDEPIELTATATSGLPVSFGSQDETIALIEGSALTVVSAGETSIAASQPGNENYLAAEEVVRTLVVEAVTGLKNDLSNKIVVYPNPSRDRLFIRHSELKEARYTLTSIGGEITMAGLMDKNGETIIETRHLKEGIYLLTISKDDNNFTYRIIKEN